MGNYFSLPTSNSNKEIEELRQRIHNLENLDRNGDGRISKEEAETWIEEKKKDLLAFENSINNKYERINQENEKYKKEITELEYHIDTLKINNERLKEELERIRVEKLENLPNANTETKPQLSELSKARINKFVDDLLNDKNVNIKYLPDFVERQIYRNVFNILINLLDNVLETTSVEFLGHKLTFDINPNDESVEEESEDE